MNTGITLASIKPIVRDRSTWCAKVRSWLEVAGFCTFLHHQFEREEIRGKTCLGLVQSGYLWIHGRKLNTCQEEHTRAILVRLFVIRIRRAEIAEEYETTYAVSKVH